MFLTLQKMALYFDPKGSVLQTADGTPKGPLSSFYFLRSLEDDVFTSPLVVYSISDERTTRYVHLLFGLRFHSLYAIDTTFASVLYVVFHDLESMWPELVKDIRRGTLKKELVMAKDHRAELESYLSPDPQRADELEVEFKKG